MRDALNATGRQMIFAGCEWAVDFPATWAAPVMHSWRATYDIQNMWECVVPHLDWLNVYADFAGPGQLGHPPYTRLPDVAISLKSYRKGRLRRAGRLLHLWKYYSCP